MSSARRRRIRAYRARRAGEAQRNREVTLRIERINRFDEAVGEIMPLAIAFVTCALVAVVMLLA